MSGFMYLLPYMEEKTLLAMFNGLPYTPTGDWYSETNNAQMAQTRIPTLVCASDDTAQENPLMATDTATQLLATASYALCSGSIGPQDNANGHKYNNNGMFYYAKQFRLKEVKDGTSKTIFLGEAIAVHPDSTDLRNMWPVALRSQWGIRHTANPMNTPALTGQTWGGGKNGSFNSRHKGGCNFAFGDGHVSFLTEHIDLATYRALSTRSRNETIVSTQY